MIDGQAGCVDLRENRFASPLLDGHSLALKKVSELVQRVAASNKTALIIGESGMGKELVARSVHICSPQRNAKFIPVNCAEISNSLIESVLFGYKKRSTSGAIIEHKGCIELADQGMLYLDEISDLDLSIQAKLFHLLEDKTINRVGDSFSVKVDIRIIAATRHKLDEMVEMGKFREDLFHRLNELTIQIPPLRRRAKDLPALIYAITEHRKKELQTDFVMNPKVMQTLVQHVWPGTVHDLSKLSNRLNILDPYNKDE